MDTKFMDYALLQAKKAYKNVDIPVGAVIVKDGVVLAKAYNTKNKTSDCTNHAEIIAIKKASKVLKDYRLIGCDIYVTKEPCLMCMGAILSSRINNLFFGAYDKKYGTTQLLDNIKFNHETNVFGGIKEKECSEMLTKFFKELRIANKNCHTDR